MDNAGSIISVVIASLIVGFLGYRVNQERQKLRRVFQVLEDAQDPLVSALDELLLSGQLQPMGAH